MTNAEMLRRLSKLSKNALKRNERAAEKMEVHWKQLAAGKLDAKSSCLFCAVALGCKLCALHVVAPEDYCAAAFNEWVAAKISAYDRKLKRPLASKACCEAAKNMLAHVRRVGRLVRKALEGKEKRR